MPAAKNAQPVLRPTALLVHLDPSSFTMVNALAILALLNTMAMLPINYVNLALLIAKLAMDHFPIIA